VFEGDSWLVYKELRQKDKKLHATLCKLLKEMLQGDPTIGMGMPTPLMHDLSGLWSRRISLSERAIYKYDSESIYIFAIGGQCEKTYDS